MITRALCTTLLVASVACGVASSAYASEMRPIEWGINRPGGDINNVVLPRDDPTLCQNRCAAMQQCLAWTFRGSDTRCWVKNLAPDPTIENTTSSGVKTVP
jgi:PAN domain